MKNIVVQQHRQQFQRGAPTNQEESDDDETITNVHTNLSQVNKTKENKFLYHK